LRLNSKRSYSKNCWYATTNNI